MKWIKDRERFLNEAKIRDVIFKKQAEVIKNLWGEKWLSYEEIIPTENIIQGKWKIEESDKNKILGAFFQCNMDKIFKIFSSLPDKFVEVAAKSIDIDLLNERNKAIFKDGLNMKKPTIDQIVIIFEPIFRKLNSVESASDKYISREPNGKPILGEDGKPIMLQKTPGDPIFTKNMVNINSFVSDYNNCYKEQIIKDPGVFANDRDIYSLRNLGVPAENRDYIVDFEIFNKDLYLKISHNPKDILNMSISKFYTSCQHLYGGGYRSQVLGNLFDPNSIPAFLTWETPIYIGDEKISDQLPLSRMVIRNIEQFDDKKKPIIFFDRAYPDRMKSTFDYIVGKYTKMVPSTDVVQYIFTPDINIGDEINPKPYMDRLPLEEKPFIGVNVKTLYLNRINDWSKLRVSPHAKIKELIIETTDLPDNLLNININPDWVKFKYLVIDTLKNFDKIKTKSIAFDKCKFGVNLFMDINNNNPDIEKIQIVSCDMSGIPDFSVFKKLEELHIVYTLNTLDELIKIIDNIKIKRLTISGDLLDSKSVKGYTSLLKGKGIKLEIVGPII